MNSKLKNILIFGAIFLLAIGVYFIFFNKPATPDLVGTSGAPVSSAPAVSSQAGQEFLTLLLNIRNIKLDDSIFSNPAFGILQDYTITLVPEGNEGRLNPFAPIGTDNSFTETASATETSPTTETIPSTTPETIPATGPSVTPGI